MNDSKKLNPAIKTLLILIILISIALLIYSGVSSAIVDSKIYNADQNAREVCLAVNKWIDNQKQSDIPLATIPGSEDVIFVSTSATGGINRIEGLKDSDCLKMELENYLSPSVKGQWIVVIDQTVNKVKYVLWSEQKISEDKIEEYISLKNRKEAYKDNKQIIGCYNT